MISSQFILVLTIFGFISFVSASSPFFLGIKPEDLKYYKSDVIKCKDGSSKFSRDKLNDDYCDCADGTDEPGTSACPGGKFYCQNAGHAPRLLFSSRVNDGICDCCDGSDEYDGKVNCSNTCWEAGKVAREKLKNKIKTYQDGVAIRKKNVQQAKEAIEKDETEVLKLKNEENILKGLVQQLKERKEQIEKAEEKERLEKEKAEEKIRLEKEKEEKRMKDSEEKTDTEEKHSTDLQHDGEKHVTEGQHDEEIHATDEQHDENYNSIGSMDEMVVDQVAVDEEETNTVADNEPVYNAESEVSPVKKLKQEKVENIEDMSREELGRLVASRWTGENAEQTKEVDSVNEKQAEDNYEAESNSHDEETDGYNSAKCEDLHKYEDEEIDDRDDEYGDEDNDDSSPPYTPDPEDSEDQVDDSDVATTRSISWLEKMQQTVRNILQAVRFFQTPVDKSEADHVRKEYDESSSKLSKIQSRISSLDAKLKLDVGPDKEFYSFYGRCFENKQTKYVYKVCPYKKATQNEGHSTTTLGHWEKFENSYRTMTFSNGDKCWNGPDRSIKVRLRCGLNDELTDVDEPSRCEYVALLSTPALCLEQKLKELQQKLQIMNSEQPQIHEEL